MDRATLAKEHGRIFLLGAGGLLLGSGFSLVTLGPSGETFIDFWIYSALGGTVGLVAGTLWHLAHPRRRRRSSPYYISTLLLPAVVLSFVALQMMSRSSLEFGHQAFDTPQAPARSFIRSTVGITLPSGVRATYFSENKVTFRISPTTLDSVESAITLDSTWQTAEWGEGVNYTKKDSSETGTHQQLYQRWNRLYQVTRCHRSQD